MFSKSLRASPVGRECSTRVSPQQHTSPAQSTPSYRLKPRRPQSVCTALPVDLSEASSSTVDVASQLILQQLAGVASSASSHLHMPPHSGDGGQSVSALLSSLHQAFSESAASSASLGADSLPLRDAHLWNSAHSSIDQLASSPMSYIQEASLSAPTTPISSIPLTSLDSTLSAIAPALPDLTASAAAAAPAAASAAHAAALGSLSAWAAGKLAVVQALDPASHASLTESVNSLLGALAGVLDVEAHAAAQHWTSALVLGVQQLVTGLQAADAVSGAGAATSYSSTISGMVAAQEAMATAAAAAGAAAGAPASGAPAISVEGLVAIATGVLALIVASVPRGDWAARSDAAQSAAAAASSSAEARMLYDSVPVKYDTVHLAAYFSKRPIGVIQRNAQVASRMSVFGVSILVDWKTGNWEKNMVLRASQFRQIVEDLGPAYIKIAQQLSTRVDICPEPYLAEFRRLQDNVRTFSTVEAREVLEEGLGQPVDRVFEWLSEEPIAAASLGQVYRGQLRPEYGSAEVAVKVQRPHVLETVARDIFIMHRGATIFASLPGMDNRWATILDDWALRFFQEMDYEQEAVNTMTFKRQMAMLEGVRVATVYPELTSRKIIVSEWVEGERLNDARTEDVGALCSTMLNCYLIQLLETGLLHADPHPGNLLRTADGKIVILDFGLMTEVTETQRIALVEFIAHLTMHDWKGVAMDLVNLGFMPDGMPPDAESLIAPVLEAVMGQIVKGGGLRGFNIGSMTAQLESVAKNYKMCIPGYFALVLRAFCVIEGIALKTDPDYAIVAQCMPYLSRRLLTDNNPRMRAALRTLLYGDGTRLDVQRLSKMLGAFSSFTTSAATAETKRLAAGPTFSSVHDPVGTSIVLAREEEGPIVNEAMKEALKVVFAKDGSYAQELLVEELVAAIDAMSREALGEGLKMVMGSASAIATLRSVEALGPLRSMLLPMPMEMLSSMAPAVALTKDDRQTLATLRMALDMMQPSLARIPDISRSGGRAIKAASELLPLMPELLPGMQVTLELFTRQLVRRMATRLADDMDPSRKPALPSKPYKSF